MKKFVILFLCSLFLQAFSSCSSSQKAMDLAEEFMSEKPDSSLLILNHFSTSSFFLPRAKARFALLKSMALDKNYIDVKEDTLIRIAYDYYSVKGSRSNRMKSSYYMGIIQQNVGKDIEAAPFFMEAETLAKSLKDKHYLALIDWHIARIYGKTQDHIRAIQYAENALASHLSIGETLAADYVRLDLSRQYIGVNDFGKAERILDTVIQNNSPESVLEQTALCRKAEVLVYGPKKDYKTAMDLYQRVLSDRSIAFPKRNWGSLAFLYEKNGKPSLANSILETMAQSMKSSTDSLRYYEAQQFIYDSRGDTQLAYRAISEGLKIQNRLILDIVTPSVSHFLESYYRDHMIIQQEQTKHTILFALILVSLLLLSIHFLIRRLNKQNQQIVEEMATIEDIEKDLERQKEKNLNSADVIHSLVSDKIRILQHIAETYFRWEEESIKKREKRHGIMTSKEMLSAFHKQVGELRKDKGFIQTLESSLNLSKNGVMDRLRLDFPKWDDEDFTLLTLFFSGFSAKSIGFFLRMSDPAVRMRKTRFKQAFEQLPDGHGKEYLERLGY